MLRSILWKIRLIKAFQRSHFIFIRNPLEELYSAFGSVIRDEDYVVAASSHKGLKSGNIDFLTFGRNEPALHHYHNTYREALGLQKLPIIES